METYPLILDGAQAGTVTVRREGGWTVFDVQCAAAEGVKRVSVYGGGAEGYLGVLAPEDGALTLHRRFSRSARTAGGIRAAGGTRAAGETHAAGGMRTGTAGDTGDAGTAARAEQRRSAAGIGGRLLVRLAGRRAGLL